MNKHPVFLSLILVVKNHSKKLHNLLQELTCKISESACDWEIVLVDNASTDDSLIQLHELTRKGKFPNIQVFSLTHEEEEEIAYWVGLENALGDYIVVFDPREDDVNFIPKLLEKAISGYDVVFAKNKSKKSGGLSYRFGYGIFNKLFKLFNGINLDKDTPHFRLLSRSVLNYVLRHQQPHLAYRHLPATLGFSKTVLEYSYTPSEKLKKNFWKGIDKGMKLLVSTTKVPMRLVTVLTIFGALSNLIYSLYVVIIWLFKTDVAPGWVSISLQQSGMFFLISLVLLVLGEYILNMVNLSNDGPLYHIGREMKSEEIIKSKHLNIEEAVKIREDVS